MSKIPLHLIAIVLIVLLNLVTSSCKKNSDPQTYSYADTFSFHYGFIPDVAGGWTPTSGLPGWFPSTGSGTSSLMANAHLYFTPYAKFNNAGTGVDNTYVPVNKYYGPQLAAAGIQVTDVVQTIVYDDQKNAVWLKALSVNSTQVSATRINVYAELDIIGGNGKFAGATGHVTEGGHFNPVDTTEGSMGIRGTIIY